MFITGINDDIMAKPLIQEPPKKLGFSLTAVEVLIFTLILPKPCWYATLSFEFSKPDAVL
jgi:hypothetical protein